MLKRALFFLLLLCLPGLALPDGTVERQTAVKLYRGTAIVAASDPKSSAYVPDLTPARCEAMREEGWQAEASKRTSGTSTWKCQVEERAIVSFSPAPVQTCGARPGADEQRQQTCPAGTVGTWLQDRTWSLLDYPTCWALSDWSPAAPPPGMCAPVAPTPGTTLYINAGGPAVSNYVADAHFVGGTVSSTCRRTYSGIFPTRRYDPASFEYRIPVANGAYAVKLLTRECWNDAVGLRSQRASIEGVSVPEYDTYTTANGGVISTERTVTVADGTLNIVVTAVKGDAILNGIDIVPASGSGPTEPAPSGTAKLNWLAPTQNKDGSALTDLAGYRVAYGATPTELVHTVQIANPGVTSYVLTELSPGTYYFGVRAYKTDGTESASSNIVSKVVP